MTCLLLTGPVLTLSLHKQHIRLYVKRLGQRLCVDWRNYHKTHPLVASNVNVFFSVLFTLNLNTDTLRLNSITNNLDLHAI